MHQREYNHLQIQHLGINSNKNKVLTLHKMKNSGEFAVRYFI